MFERFTNQARHVVVRAQEEARLLEHNYIGTEHLLLGIFGEPDGFAFRALASFGMSLESTREDVKAIVGTGNTKVSGHIPFTPRAKKILELSLREAVRLRHDHIGTEHILLGVIAEGDGVGARILRQHSPDLMAIRMAILDMLGTVPPEATRSRRWARRRSEASLGLTAEPGEPPDMRTTPAADTSLSEAARLAGSQPVGSHHLLLAALGDPDTAAARAMAALGVDLDRAKEALRTADVTGTSDEQPEEAGRRQLLIRLTGNQLTIEITDPVIVDLGRAALEALGDQASPPGVIRGDLPVSGSLAHVWQALHDSLEAIARRAAPPVAPPAARAG
jgi:ATP-dependent Clp protease ATP-binding subunit ClpC